MENVLKTLIILTLIFYLIKGLFYLLLWQATHAVEEKALATKEEKKQAKLEKRKAKRNKEEEEEEEEPSAQE
ncbi:MAG TPA: hypothetical protein VFC73_01910 [Syntrophomonadaceae bacterium]|nr:hypothetical protein [Syntrophomonadaceae bacterium]